MENITLGKFNGFNFHTWKVKIQLQMMKVDEDDAKAILLNSLSQKYDNVIFTLTQMPSRTLEDMISALLAEERRMKEGEVEVSSHSEVVLYSKGRRTNKSIECF
jgi:hypothetical protein